MHDTLRKKLMKKNISVYNAPNTIARYQMTKEITVRIGRRIISRLAQQHKRQRQPATSILSRLVIIPRPSKKGLLANLICV